MHTAHDHLRSSVNGLPLPLALLSVIRSDRWSFQHTALRRVFRERRVDPVLSDMRLLEQRNDWWSRERDPAYFGHPDDKQPPGDIDQELSVLIGELGPDLLLALDYRQSMDRPRVVYLHSEGDRWITIASCVEDLLARLDSTDRSLRRADWSSRDLELEE